MPKKSMEQLTESMFYCLMALTRCPMCGIDIAAYVQGKTGGRVVLGPATLYTILGKFEKEGYIRQTDIQGRKRTYTITVKGKAAYEEELDRLRLCILDAQRADDAFLPEEAPRMLTGDTVPGTV